MNYQFLLVKTACHHIALCQFELKLTSKIKGISDVMKAKIYKAKISTIKHNRPGFVMQNFQYFVILFSASRSSFSLNVLLLLEKWSILWYVFFSTFRSQKSSLCWFPRKLFLLSLPLGNTIPGNIEVYRLEYLMVSNICSNKLLLL